MTMKTLCDWSGKDIAKKIDELAALVAEPTWVCRKCARVAAKKGALCKPTKLPKRDDD